MIKNKVLLIIGIAAIAVVSVFGDTDSLRRQWQIPTSRIIEESNRSMTVLLSREMPLVPDEYRFFSGRTKTAVINGVNVTFVKPAYLAVVIDDVPENWDNFRKTFLTLDIPMTFSVFPFVPNAKTLATIIRDAGFDVQIHMPMEPEDYPKMSPGPKAIFTFQSAEENIALIDEACKLLPEAVGLNNHMGSKSTTDLAVMTPVLLRLKQKGMYFLDSKTSPKSICAVASAQTGVLYIANQLFLDDTQRTASVADYLDRAAAIALEKGYTVAIGHTYKETYEAITSRIVNYEKRGIEFITVRELISITRSSFYERNGY